MIFCMETIAGDCYAAASVHKLSNNGLECANGHFVSSWNGCVKLGSARVRCPKDLMPCNDLAGNGIEFSCWKDCIGHGGVKDCFLKGIFCDRTDISGMFG